MTPPTYNARFSLYEGDLIAGGNPRCGEVGGTRFFGLLMGQNQHALPAFDTLLKALEEEGCQAARIIELGTSHGGMSIFLRLYSLVQGIAFVTYDRPDFTPTYSQLFTLLGIDYRQADLLHDSSAIQEIGDLISQPGATVMLCDNGNKRQEFAIYSEYLKAGDVILAHDYAPNVEHFAAINKDRLWPCLEIEESDVATVCLQHALKPFLQPLFDKAAWVCCRKVLDHR